MLQAQRALLSVSNKDGIAELGKALEALGIEILSTGGTMKHLEDAGVAVKKVSQITGSPEILDGRVKTLHPTIHGGILADRSRSSHLSELHEHGIRPIDLVVVNLYPFEETVAREGASANEIIENIDIGGPCMLRAAAKNHAGVVVVVDPADYPQVVTSLQESDGIVPDAMRRRLALKAFRHTQAYDTAIANWLERETSTGLAEGFPQQVRVDLVRELEPRYGENPHQGSAVYRTVGESGIFGGFEQLQGKELSWNNMLDADAARKLVSLFEAPTVVISKHNNPCGVGTATNMVDAYQRALACDPVSAFGSVIAVNRDVDQDLAKAMKELFVEVIVAPEFSDGAKTRYSAKRNLRLIESPLYAPQPSEFDLRGISGGFLAQNVDAEAHSYDDWLCVTNAKPTEDQRRALELNWTVCRHVKSNAIVVGNKHQTVGVGAGQMSRVDSCRLALEKAVLPLQGTVAASDAFFPFRDGVDTLAEGGVTAIVQPGGSKRDDEVIAAANDHGITMLMTGRRHFKH